MSYIVMECHKAYVIVLDSEGRFLKAANLGYEVGQKTDFIVGADAHPTKTRQQPGRRKFATWAVAAAACVCLIAMSSYEYVFKAVGTINININPQVEIYVNKLDRVIDIEGKNEDGERLTEDYHAFGKKASEAADELADRAIEMGFLTENGRITIYAESDDEQWKNRIQEDIIYEISLHVGDRYYVTAPETQMTVTIERPENSGDISMASGDSGYTDSTHYGGNTNYDDGGDSGYDSENGDSEYDYEDE
ncbi:MAG: hypothetical protein UIJ88_01670 [Anaerovoracaceae bacterium]|nr:hypothetical protein [Anaerovoracaceae bacterium]